MKPSHNRVSCAHPGILLITALSTGCGELPRDGINELSVVESDSAGATIVEVSGRLSDLPIWTVVGEPLLQVYGDSSPVFGAIGEVALLDSGSVMVEDDQSSRLYRIDSGGARLIGRAGDGPGEFRDIEVLTVGRGDTVYAYDRHQNRLSILDASGQLVRTIPIDPALSNDGTTPIGVRAFDSDHLILHGRSPRDPAIVTGQTVRDQRHELLLALDGSGSPKSGRPVRFQGGYNILGDGIIIVSPFANVPLIASGPGRVVSGSGIDYELMLHGPALEPLRIIRWADWPTLISASMIESVRAEAEEAFAGMRAQDPAAVDRILDAMFREELLPEHLPVLGAALIDNRGRIWVSEFRPATRRWDEAEAWHVLDRDGAPLARLRIPTSSRLVAARGDTIVLVIRDEMDVQNLQIHELVEVHTDRSTK